MSDPPVVFKRSKKQTQRSRLSTPGVTDGQEKPTEGEQVDSPSVLATKLKQKLRTKPKSRLSFGGDEEGDGEVFQVKKSNLSKKLALGRNASSSVLPSNFTPTVTPSEQSRPVYNAAYLNELKASTPSTRPSLPADSSVYDGDISMDIDATVPSTSIIDITGDEPETAIPSGSSITAAKQKRERLRDASKHGEQDFISLSVSKRSDYAQGPHPESRLVREDDELGDADDEYAEYTSAQERIALGKKSRKVEARKKREEMQEMIVDAEDEDEETAEWEQEQLRRGGHRPSDVIPAKAKPAYKAAPIPPMTEIPTLASAVGRLSQSLTALTTSHAQNSQSMTAIGAEQTELERKEREMREMITKAEDKRGWFVAFREWVESVAGFLDEKYPQLEKLEDEHTSLLKERANMIVARRRAEDEDDLSLFLGTLPQNQPGPDQVDELGRTIPSANPTVARRDRLTARSTRHSFRRQTRAPGQHEEDEGFSTDASLPPTDKADYASAMHRVLRDKDEVMADVKAEDFRDPARGLGRWFSEWRERFGESYRGAWGGLGMVGAWEWWVRLEIVGWDPLEDSRTLDTFTWYQELYKYSRVKPAGAEDEEPEMGPDGDLVSAMISTAVIPRLCRLVEAGAFDPYSSRDLRKLVDLAEQIEAEVERGSLKFGLLLKAVYTSLADAVSASETLAAPYLALRVPPRFDPESIPARRRYLARQYKLLRALVQWRRYAGERGGSIGALAGRLVEDVMLPVMESGWEVGGEEYARKVTQALPADVVPPSLKMRKNAA